MKVLLRLLLVLCIIATVTFIFYNSTLPPEQSSEQSGAIGDIIAGIIPPDTTLGAFLQTYLRKIAHFTEFGLLGMLVTLLLFLADEKKIRHLTYSFTFAMTVGLADESIQIFSGRGPQVEDVLVDVGGYIFFGILTVLAVGLIALIRAAVRHKRNYY